MQIPQNHRSPSPIQNLHTKQRVPFQKTCRFSVLPLKKHPKLQKNPQKSANAIEFLRQRRLRRALLLNAVEFENCGIVAFIKF
jgi:hypothetical protein